MKKTQLHKQLDGQKKNVGLSTEDFCKLIDKDLWNETIFEMRLLEKDAENILSKINFSLGGGGNYYLLYFLIRKTSPKIVVETGVAAGWSSLCILRAFKKSLVLENYIQVIFHIFVLKTRKNILESLPKRKLIYIHGI